MSNKDLDKNAFKTMKLKRNWDRWVLNPMKTSSSEVIFNDLMNKISNEFFKKSRDFSLVGTDHFVQQAYGINIYKSLEINN